MTSSTPQVVEEQIAFANQLGTVSKELSIWAAQQFDAGRSLDHVKDQLLRVMKIVTPLREALPGHGFSQEDIWHEQRALGCTEAQAIRSLTEAEARLDD